MKPASNYWLEEIESRLDVFFNQSHKKENGRVLRSSRDCLQVVQHCLSRLNLIVIFVAWEKTKGSLAKNCVNGQIIYSYIVWIPYGQSIRSVMFSSDIATPVKQSCQRKNHLFLRRESLYQGKNKTFMSLGNTGQSPKRIRFQEYSKMILREIEVRPEKPERPKRPPLPSRNACFNIPSTKSCQGSSPYKTIALNDIPSAVLNETITATTPRSSVDSNSSFTSEITEAGVSEQLRRFQSVFKVQMGHLTTAVDVGKRQTEKEILLLRFYAI